MDLLELASQIERAPAGSEYLDCAVQRLFGVSKPIPAFTQSVDTALRIVPRGWDVHRLSRRVDRSGGFGNWVAQLYRADSVEMDSAAAAEAKTAPLALCAAALRACHAAGIRPKMTAGA